ncbi:hypothetical protein L0F63_002115 [Massospora cicadina]|nr:hypothetical protein L0F63_002115 [Massospora cicadina]
MNLENLSAVGLAFLNALAVHGDLEAETRILGGQETEMINNNGKVGLRFPFMASLQLEERHQCGGTVVNNMFIITAGHCSNTTENWTARINAIKLSSKDGDLEGRAEGSPPVQRKKVVKIYLHPKFSLKPIQNDIAIWEVEHMTGFEPSYIRFALKEHEVFDTYATIAGWGTTVADRKIASNNLHQLDIIIYNQEKCKTLLHDLKGTAYSEETHLCASSGEDGKDGCYGDSGGPLFTKYDESTFLLFGVTSYGASCGNKSMPGADLQSEFSYLSNHSDPNSNTKPYSYQLSKSACLATLLSITATYPEHLQPHLPAQPFLLASMEGL